MNTAASLNISVWLLVALVTVVGTFAWSINIRLPISIAELFPLLGILAFSIMWTHYVSGTIRRRSGQDKSVLKSYFSVTSIIVLALILLHPGLFYLQLYIDGFGLPPASYMQVYPEAASLFAIMLGTLSLLIFLAFELKRKFSDKSWWKYVDYAQIFAMFAVFYHALSLGGELMNGWFRTIWFIYGITLILAVVYNHIYDRRK